LLIHSASAQPVHLLNHCLDWSCVVVSKLAGPDLAYNCEQQWVRSGGAVKAILSVDNGRHHQMERIEAPHGINPTLQTSRQLGWLHDRAPGTFKGINPDNLKFKFQEAATWQL